MTNPDAPVNEHCIEVQVDGANVWAMPILLSREERYDPAAGAPFFGYLTLSMLLVERADSAAAASRPLERNVIPFPNTRPSRDPGTRSARRQAK